MRTDLALSHCGNTAGSHPDPAPLTTSDITISLLIDISMALEEIQARIHARAFAAVMDPTKARQCGRR
ncbi:MULTISPECIES: hypothetical protein [Aphanothece]|uniref:hypothetical protein n=1 Tax=Aphanothece TaxID=1121 RepID=UPI00398542D5